MRVSKQWVLVGVIVAGLALGAWAMVRFRPETDQVVVGSRAPDFRVIDLTTGDSVRLHDRYKDKVTLVNIWATWCEPCRVEMPAIQRAYARLKPRGFQVASISVDEGSPDVVRAFARQFGLTFDIMHDQSGLIQRAYQMTGLPETFLLDNHGIILKREIGAHDWASPTNLALINRLLDQAGAPIVKSLDTVATQER